MEPFLRALVSRVFVGLELSDGISLRWISGPMQTHEVAWFELPPVLMSD